MIQLDLAKKILSDIKEGDTQFSEALRKVFQADPEIRMHRASVSGLVGCVLRHDLLLNYLLEKFEGFTADDKAMASLAIANLFYYKRFDHEEVLSALKESLGEEKLAMLDSIFAKVNTPEEIIPSELSRSSDKYLSLRYNTPEWVLKIWKHYGHGITYKILKKNSRPLDATLRVRRSKLEPQKVLDSIDFAKSPVDDIFFYRGKEALRKNEWVKNGSLFAEKMGVKATLDKFVVSEPSEVLLYNGNADSSIIKELIETYGPSVGLNIGVPNTDKYPEILKMIKEMGLRNVNFYGADPLSMVSAISRPQELVIAAPDSSNFDLIRNTPDYLLHFKKNEMDDLFKQEKDVLEGCSKFVAEDGTLIYMIMTISRKEGHSTVSEFVRTHEDFELLSEMQMFPYEEYDTSMYYAVLHKKVNALTLGTPMGEMSLSAASLSSGASASAK